jgi:membrane associated rhomboid family serine protease
VLFVLVVLGLGAAAIYRGTTVEERTRFLVEYVQPAAAAIDEMFFAARPFRETLRKRTPRLLATPAIGGLMVVFFASLYRWYGGDGERAALIAWGASYGPATTNGEWWRLLTATFLQPGPFHLLFVLIGFAQVAELLERLVGPYIIGTVFLAAGSLGTLVTLTTHPLGVFAGGAAAVCGLYGLLAAVMTWTFVRLDSARVPLPVLKTLAPAAIIFLLYTLLSFEVSGDACRRGFVVGLLSGLVLAVDAGAKQPSLKPLAIVLPASVALITFLALPLRGIVDLRPELAGIVAREDLAADMYRAAVGRYTRHQRPIDTARLIELIDHTILPQLGTQLVHVASLTARFKEQQPLIDETSEYLRLRVSSWRLRAEALRKSNMATLREAEQTEQESLRALQKVRQIRASM